MLLLLPATGVVDLTLLQPSAGRAGLYGWPQLLSQHRNLRLGNRPDLPRELRLATRLDVFALRDPDYDVHAGSCLATAETNVSCLCWTFTQKDLHYAKARLVLCMKRKEPNWNRGTGTAMPV